MHISTYELLTNCDKNPYGFQFSVKRLQIIDIWNHEKFSTSLIFNQKATDYWHFNAKIKSLKTHTSFDALKKTSNSFIRVPWKICCSITQMSPDSQKSLLYNWSLWVGLQSYRRNFWLDYLSGQEQSFSFIMKYIAVNP